MFRSELAAIRVQSANMNPIIFLTLFVAAASAASFYPRTPASTYLFGYPMAYPANYHVEPVFKYDVDMRQDPPLPIAQTQEAVTAVGNWQVQSTMAFWRFMNCLINSSCSTLMPPTAYAVLRMRKLLNRVMKTVQTEVPPLMAQLLAEEFKALISAQKNPPTVEDVLRNIPALADQYPEYFVDLDQYA